MAREHTQLFLARLQLTSLLTLQRANRVPQRGGINSARD